MGIQLILVVETNRKADIDVGYLNEIIHYYYDLKNEVSIKYIYMEGKHNYNQRRVEKEIKRYCSMYSGKSHVIYVFDRDQHYKDIRDENFINDVCNYCDQEGYEIIWFVRNIEDVLHKKHVESNKKKEAMIAFKRTKQIQKVEARNLSSPNPRQSKTSNILYVFDKYISSYRKL